MRKIIATLVAIGMTAALSAPAYAQYGAKPAPKAATPELPRCAAPIATVAIQEPEIQWWRSYGLSNPEKLLKLFASRSNCLRVVDRGAGLQMRQGERALGESGELRRDSQIGRGQVVAADYFIIPDLANADDNTGGGEVAGVVGGLIGGRAGAAVGGLRTRNMEAQALITLVDARTTEQVYVAEGTAKKRDIGWSAGGGAIGLGAIIGAVGGGYSDTDIGKIISAAYFNAFIDLVNHIQAGGVAGQEQAKANAGPVAQVTTRAVELRQGPSLQSKVIYSMAQGSLVYPTGARNGVWMEVDDENGNRGWISSAYASPR
ncbi:MAG TPA: SH3 domain-containing protein [Caulobacter sp.]|nr:SH3 domain-containing protein [Caulobacter sp.]